jgi:phosphoglycolate phosphatase-like HAD superfamily hydrolase
MARIRAVLFDIDGTLLDSNDAHAHAWIDALRGHGVDLPLERVRSRIGMSIEALLADLASVDADSATGRAILERRTSILKSSYLGEVGPFHGARMLVDRLRSRGLVCGAITSCEAAEADELLRAAGVGDLMDLIVSAEDLLRSRKRGTHGLVLAALEQMGIRAEEALLIGDTPFDIEAGRRTGVRVVALRCGGGWSDRELGGAEAIYDDPAALSSRLDASPLALDRDSDPPPSPMKIGSRRATA